MKNTCVVLCLLFLASSVALAQEKTNVQWKCDKPSVQHSIPVGDNVAFDCTGTYTPRHNLGQAAPLRGGAGVRLFASLLARGRSGSMHYEIACG